MDRKERQQQTVKVHVRQKPGGRGKLILYLDFSRPIINPDTGKPTRREFPGLSIFEKPRTTEEAAHNAAQRATAEKIRAIRQQQILSGEYGQKEEKQSADFVAYFRQLASQRKGSNSDNWASTLNYLEGFTGGAAKFAALDVRFCEDFRDYLLTTPSSRSSATNLSQNSVASYFNKFKAALKQAYRDGYLTTDLNARIGTVKQAETHRKYLSLEELQMLAKTDCDDPILKRAALFSALTGLRFSDIQKLVWGEVCHSTTSGHYLQFKQKKTGGAETLPIGEQAANLLGERGEPDAPIFKGLVYSAWQNLKLKRWILKAGISKDVTFHSFRHTYATLQLSLGTDIYTVSKMLGHKDLKTTQLYSKIVDEKKREAADRIQIEF